jgi:hypothetical protein
MAQSKTVATTPTKKSPQEIKDWYMENREKLQYAAAKSADSALKSLRDITKSTTYKTISSYSKESLRTYLQNVSSNEKNLRNLSRYLYYRSQVYYRLICYNANMFCLDSRSVIPPYDMVEENDSEVILQSYNATLNALDKMDLQYEFLKIYMTCFREDVFYGVYYFDPESEGAAPFFILPLDPDYCKIEGVYMDTGDFAFAMDMSYFRSHSELLEYWGEPFQSLYNTYQSSGVKWQSIPPEYGVCLKARAEDWETIVPPFAGLFNSLISLVDQEDISAIADQQSIYKLLWMEMETFDNGQPNDFKVDPESVTIPYWNRMLNEALPDYVSAAILPGKLNAISFDNDQTTDTTKIEQATETVLNTSGGAQILNSASISGTTAFNAAVKSDTEFAISMLLPQTQKVVNRILSYYVDNPSRVKFFEVSVYTKDAFKETILKHNEYGLAPKLLVNSLNGFSEKETLALNFLEQDVLHLQFTPVSSTHTQSGSANEESGGQTKSDTEITDDGEASRDKRDNAKG